MEIGHERKRGEKISSEQRRKYLYVEWINHSYDTKNTSISVSLFTGQQFLRMIWSVTFKTVYSCKSVTVSQQLITWNRMLERIMYIRWMVKRRRWMPQLLGWHVTQEKKKKYNHHPLIFCFVYVTNDKDPFHLHSFFSSLPETRRREEMKKGSSTFWPEPTFLASLLSPLN